MKLVMVLWDKRIRQEVICVSVIEVFWYVCRLQSVVARGLLNSIQEKAGYLPVYINFSAQTSSARTQEIIESKLEKKRKNILGIGSQVVLPHNLYNNLYTAM